MTEKKKKKSAKMPLLQKPFMHGPYQVVEHCGHIFSDINKAKLYE